MDTASPCGGELLADARHTLASLPSVRSYVSIDNRILYITIYLVGRCVS
jgi:hypothetical protein